MQIANGSQGGKEQDLCIPTKSGSCPAHPVLRRESRNTHHTAKLSDGLMTIAFSSRGLSIALQLAAIAQGLCEVNPFDGRARIEVG